MTIPATAMAAGLALCTGLAFRIGLAIFFFCLNEGTPKWVGHSPPPTHTLPVTPTDFMCRPPPAPRQRAHPPINSQHPTTLFVLPSQFSFFFCRTALVVGARRTGGRRRWASSAALCQSRAAAAPRAAPPPLGCPPRLHRGVAAAPRRRRQPKPLWQQRLPRPRVSLAEAGWEGWGGQVGVWGRTSAAHQDGGRGGRAASHLPQRRQPPSPSATASFVSPLLRLPPAHLSRCGRWRRGTRCRAPPRTRHRRPYFVLWPPRPLRATPVAAVREGGTGGTAGRREEGGE